MKKQLQSLAVAFMAVAGFSNHVSALNTYAYGMGAALSEDAATLSVTYSLNADATAVSVVFYNGTEAVKTVDLEAAYFTAGSHAVDVATKGLPQGAQITWAVKATSAVVETPTEHSVGYQFYHPRSVEVDNNTESPYFGRVYLTEAMVAKKDVYLSYQTGMGLYAFDPQLTPILNKDSKPGFKGGQTFPEKYENGAAARAYSPTRVRVTADGRVFVSAQNDLGVAMWEINPADLNADWAKVIYGTPNAEDYKMYTADNVFVAGPNIGLDVRGEGENLTVLMHSSSKANTGFTYAVSTDEYKLGTAKEWTVAPSTNIDPLTDVYSITPSYISTVYDKDGGIWYCQYRGTPTDEQPGLVHVSKNADGTYVEDYKDLEARGGGGIRFNQDFTQVAIAKGKGGVSIYTVDKDEAGKPVLTELYNFDTTIGTNVNDIAWDAANNLYVCGNSREWLKVFALPRANGDVTVPAPTAAAFTLPAAPEPQPQPELVYNLKEVSKLTEGLPAKSEARQAALGKDGKIYIHDKANKVIEVWTMDGKTTEVLAEAGANTSVTTDDAGNVIVPGAGYEFPGAAFNNLTSLKVYPADGSAAVEVAVSGMPAGRTDFLGHINGNILAGEAVMYVPAKDTQDVVALRFVGGAQDGDAVVLTLTNANAADNMTVAHAEANGFMYHRRGAKASVRLVKAEYDEAMDEYTVDDSFLVTTPGMQASVGATKFTMGGVDYVVYPTGSGYYDGWAIVKASNAEDNAVLVEHPESMTNVTSGYQTNWLMVDVLNETKAMVYQYFPGGYFATYEFTATRDDIPTPAPVYPENVYLAGHLENAAWDPAYDGYKMTATANEGEYSIENVVIVEADAEANKGFGYFAFTTAVGTWDEVNASDRFGAESADLLIESEKSANVVKGQYSWKVAAGTYNMVLNLKDMTLVITKMSGVDAVEVAAQVIAGVGVINVVGEAETVEVYSMSGALVSAGETSVECAPGVYLVRVDRNVTKVVVR